MTKNTTTRPVAGPDPRDPAQAFARAEALAGAGRSAEAETIYRRLLEQFPDQVAVLHHLAVLLKGRGEFSEAERLLRRGLALEPREPALHNAMGSLLRAAGRLRDAEAAYRRALELWPDFAEAQYNLAITLEDLGLRAEALAAHRRAVQLSPGFGKALTRIGALLLDEGRAQEALPSLQEAATVAPMLFDAHYYLGWSLSEAGQHDAALASLRRATELRPDSFEAAMATANALRDAGRNDAALEAYQNLLRMRPERAETHEEINKLAWMARRPDLFLRSFEYARERIGDEPDLLKMEAAFELRRSGHPAAERLLRRALELAPKRGDLAGMLARALAGQGRLQESYPLFSEAIGLEPGVMLHRHELGFTLLRDRQAADARRVFEQANAIAPSDQLALAGLTAAYRHLGDSRYAELVNHERYVQVFDLQTPLGYRDMDEFNRALASELDELHTMRAEPIDQTLRSGTQTTGQLFARGTPAIAQVRELIDAAVSRYVRDTNHDPSHPLEIRRQPQFEYRGSWSCRLASGGYHSNHVHPQGWISSAYYARLPAGVEDATGRAGWLKFGESNLDLGADDAPQFHVQPRVGRLVLFPSFYWHGTVPFSDAADRLSLAFDVAPIAGRAGAPS